MPTCKQAWTKEKETNSEERERERERKTDVPEKQHVALCEHSNRTTKRISIH
jgi:hypothetical protein